MNPWVPVAAGLLGVVVGIVGKYLADLRTARTKTLLDEKLKHAVKFLATADHLRRLQPAASLVKSAADVESEDPTANGSARKLYRERLEIAIPVVTEAEDAYNALRLLIPVVAGPAQRYLEPCKEADLLQDAAPRERARHTAEEAIRRAIGV